MKKEDIMGAIGDLYLKGRLSSIWVEDKFCIMDNLGGDAADAAAAEHMAAPRLRFPLKVTLTICVFCRQGKVSIRIQQKDYVLESGGVLVIFGGQILARLPQDLTP